MKELYFSSTLMWGASPWEIFDLASCSGMDGIEIWHQQADSFGWDPEEIGGMARSSGLNLLVHGKSWDLNFASLNEGIRRASLAELKGSLLFAARCGAQETTLHPPRYTLSGMREQAVTAGRNGLAELLDEADRLEIDLSLEVMEKIPRELVTTPEEFEIFAGGLLPRLNCTLDLAHCQNEAEFWDYLSRLPQISKLHISNKRDKKLHTPLDDGDFDMARMLPRLRNLDLPLVIEGWDGEDQFHIINRNLTLLQTVGGTVHA